MTGNEMLAEFKAVVANDLYPVAASTDAARFALLNIAARRVMQDVKFLVRAVPLTYAAGTTRYDLRALPIPLLEAHKVVYLDVPYYRDEDSLNKGWSQMDRYIDIFFTVANAALVYIDGYRSAVVPASDVELTEIPDDLHLAVVQLAIVEGCVGNEDDQGQLVRLARLEKTALEKVGRKAAAMSSSRWPFIV